MSVAAPRVYLPSAYPKEKALLGELELVSVRLEELLLEIEHVLQSSPRSAGWQDVGVATRIGLRALTAAVASVPELPPLDTEQSLIQLGELRIDLLGRRQWYGETEVKLTPLHHQVLATMAADPHRVFHKDELQRAVWGKTGRSNSVNHSICRTRAALVRAGAPPGRYLIPLPTGGWTLTTPEEP